MDVSKLCINEDVVNSSSPPINRPRLLPTHEDENVNNNNSTLYQNTPQFTYQQNYQLQHRNLKNYTFLQQIQPPPPPPLPSSTNTSNYPPPPLPSLPPISYPTVTYATQPPPDNSTKLNQLLEQCNLIHSRIGKYRVDPLTESERSQIIDQVYYTAETMLASIKELQSEETHDNDINMMDDVSESSMNNNNNNRMNDDSQTDEYKMIRQARNLQDANARPKYRRRSKRSMIGQRCHSCNTTETPEWRRGPDGARTLCNACGLHYSKLLRKGSMTVQTHNFALDSPPGIQIPTRIIQYPCPSPSLIKNNDDMDDRS